MVKSFKEYKSRLKKRNRYLIAIVLILLFHLVNNYIWLKMDSFPFGTDELVHLKNAMMVPISLKINRDFYYELRGVENKYG